MIVLFDSNGYRNFVCGKTLATISTEMQVLRAQEIVKGYKPHICTTVAMELLSSLTHQAVPRIYNSCLNACLAMYLHCGNKTTFPALPLPEVQIAKEYFGIEDTQSIATQEGIGQVLYQISQSPIDKTIQSNIININQIKQFIVNAEQTYANEVLAYMKNIDPQAQKWHFFQNNTNKRQAFLTNIRSNEFDSIAARAMLTAVANLLKNRGYQVHEISQLQVNKYIESYKTSLIYRKKCWERFSFPGYDLTKKSRSNAIWDEYILHFIGHTINQDNILLVTDDKLMNDAAKEVNPNALIYTYKEYINLLK